MNPEPERATGRAGRHQRGPAAPAAALALGALHTLSYHHTGLWWLQLVCVGGLVFMVRHAGARRAAALGWAFGTGWLCAAVWWLFISMHRYGNLPAWLAALAVLALACALSIYLALAMAMAARWRTGHAGLDATVFAAAWLAAELARTALFTGFPWAASGYAHVDSPLAVLAPWIGVLGIGAVASWLVALPALAPRRVAAWALPAVLLALAAWAGPAQFDRPGGRLTVTLLQTNVPQDEKFVVERLPETLREVAAALSAARGELVVTPETAVPLLPSQLDEVAPGYWRSLAQSFDRGDRAALIGVPLGDYDRGYSNSVLGLTQTGAGAPPYRYDKQHLVPFGEFIPLGFRWFTTLLNLPLGDFMRGARVPPSFAFHGQRIAPNICYEDLYGDELALRFADPAQAPTLFVNVSNIGWFGDTIAVQQHLNISRLRTLEFQRPMLRATNTGATAVIDHRGRVRALLAPFTRGVLDAEVQGRSGITPYAWWAARAGLWPYLLGSLLVLGTAWRAASKRRP